MSKDAFSDPSQIWCYFSCCCSSFVTFFPADYFKVHLYWLHKSLCAPKSCTLWWHCTCRGWDWGTWRSLAGPSEVTPTEVKLSAHLKGGCSTWQEQSHSSRISSALLKRDDPWSLFWFKPDHCVLAHLCRWLQQDHCDRRQCFRITLWHPQVSCSCLHPAMAICRGTTTYHSSRLLCSFGIMTFRGKNKKLCTANAVLMAHAGSFIGLLNRRETKDWCLSSTNIFFSFCPNF